MFFFHVSPLPAPPSSLQLIPLLRQYYMSVTVHPGTPLDPQPSSPAPLPTSTVSASLLSIVGFISLSSSSPTARHRAVREIQAAQEKRNIVDGRRETSGNEGSSRGDEIRYCKKCPPGPNSTKPPKPERTHHCSVCRTCILKFDHQYASFPPIAHSFSLLIFLSADAFVLTPSPVLY